MSVVDRVPARLLGAARPVIAGLAVASSLALPLSSAVAAELSFPFETQVPGDEVAGSAAGRLKGPSGIATDPVTHRVYVSDLSNKRVSAYTPWGEFVMAFGWGVRNGDPEPQTCTSETGCQAGLSGSGPGEFGDSLYFGPNGIAVDESGDIYVMDLGNRRVQKFDSEGNFILTFGGKVDQDTEGNVCTAASGHTCVAGQVGTGPSEFAITYSDGIGIRGDYLDVAPDGSIYVGDRNRIQVFEPDGSFKSSFPLPEPGNPGALAIDPNTGTVYFAFAQDLQEKSPGVYSFTSSGELLETVLPVGRPSGGIAVDADSNVYVVSGPPFDFARVAKFDASGALLGEFGYGTKQPFFELRGLATGLVTEDGASDLYVGRATFVSPNPTTAAFRVYGTIPDSDLVGPPPSVPPEITDQYAVSVGSRSALLRARVNPHFWDDTTLYVQYGTADCETSACAAHPSAPGKLLTEKVTALPQVSPGIFLGDLQPNTTYHYRIVAQSGGGGPVHGPDRTFTTPPLPGPVGAGCANSARRAGAASFLADCRGYEMVSPVDKGGAGIGSLLDSHNIPVALTQAAEGGDRVTYTSQKSFAGALGSPYAPQYLAERSGDGWHTDAISPPRSGASFNSFVSLWRQFKGFSPDLCSGWFVQDAEPVLAPGAVPGFFNLYRQDLCGGGGYEALSITPPPERGSDEFFLALQGFSADGHHAVFAANDALSEDAPSGTAAKVYDYSAGQLRYVCLLPGGTPLTTGCSVGTSTTNGGLIEEYGRSVENAVSADGSRIFWTASGGAGAGKLYARVDGEVTVAISKKSQARFWGASPDGTRAIFSEGGSSSGGRELYEFKLGEDFPEDGTPIAGDVYGVAGMSEDATRVYFASGEALDGAAQAGEPNLYLYELGEGVRFIATLASEDVGDTPLSPLATSADQHMARVTPDGTGLAFISKASLTGFDNRSVSSGEPLWEVYHYDAASGELVCASCNPTGARPVGRDVKHGNSMWRGVAAWIPGSTTSLYAPRALSDDGKRLYFNAIDALVPRDTNGVLDVYQWEARGSGDCSEPGGCVSLISTGKSPQDSEFLDADVDGRDVFFTTGQSLVDRDPGLIDVYDARADGGFAPPPPPPPACEGDACQPPPAPPHLSTPASAAFHGAGNPRPQGKAPGRCNRAARQARRLSHRAKRMRRNARRAQRSGAGRARALERTSRRLARRAKSKSKRATRCRGRARNHRRAGR